MLPSIGAAPHYINFHGFSIKVYATMTSLYFCCHLIVLCHALFLHRPTSVLPPLGNMLLHTPQFFFRTPFLHAGQYLIQNISLKEKREQLQKPLQECDKVLCTSPLRLQLPMSRFDVEKLQVVLFICNILNTY